MTAFVVVYTVSGGSAAVSRTQELQMTVMLGGLVLAFFLIVKKFARAGIGVGEAWEMAANAGKTQALDWSFSWNDRYNVWSGLLNGFFVSLSYFGTDQSQVGHATFLEKP